MFSQFDFVFNSEFLIVKESHFEHKHFDLNSRDWFHLLITSSWKTRSWSNEVRLCWTSMNSWSKISGMCQVFFLSWTTSLEIPYTSLSLFSQRITYFWRDVCHVFAIMCSFVGYVCVWASITYIVIWSRLLGSFVWFLFVILGTILQLYLYPEHYFQGFYGHILLSFMMFWQMCNLSSTYLDVYSKQICVYIFSFLGITVYDLGYSSSWSTPGACDRSFKLSVVSLTRWFDRYSTTMGCCALSIKHDWNCTHFDWIMLLWML